VKHIFSPKLVLLIFLLRIKFRKQQSYKFRKQQSYKLIFFLYDPHKCCSATGSVLMVWSRYVVPVSCSCQWGYRNQGEYFECFVMFLRRSTEARTESSNFFLSFSNYPTISCSCRPKSILKSCLFFLLFQPRIHDLVCLSVVYL
jgi:hypothetical protein